MKYVEFSASKKEWTEISKNEIYISIYKKGNKCGMWLNSLKSAIKINVY